MRQPLNQPAHQLPSERMSQRSLAYGQGSMRGAGGWWHTTGLGNEAHSEDSHSQRLAGTAGDFNYMEKKMKNDVIEMEAVQQKSSAVAARKPRQLVAAPSQPATPADMVMYALQNGGSLEQVRELMQMRREWEADEARKAFNVAEAAFKAESIVVTKDKDNTQYKSKYTTLGNLVGTVTPFLSKHGLSADWDIDQTSEPGKITVICFLKHSQGHSKKVAFTVPPDTAGAKNPIQQIKSSITYAKSVTFESVCGMASTDANLDDDGNGSSELREMAKEMKLGSKAPAKPLIDSAALARALKSIKAGEYTYADLIEYYSMTEQQVAYARKDLGLEGVK
jgi:hypothetical protein